MSTLTDYFPTWGAAGSQWTSGGDWVSGDQVSEATMDYLFDKLNKQENDFIDHFTTDGFAPSASGIVDDGDAKLLYVHGLADGETIKVTQASFVESDASAIPTGTDLVIATLDSGDSDGGTIQTTALSGDGTTVYDDQTGAPLAQYTNSSGGAQTVGILVDNGNFSGGSGGASASVDHHVSVKGRVE